MPLPKTILWVGAEVMDAVEKLEQGGDDEETRAMAMAIIDDQEKEIVEMRAMLERMGVEAPAQ